MGTGPGTSGLCKFAANFKKRIVDQFVVIRGAPPEDFETHQRQTAALQSLYGRHVIGHGPGDDAGIIRRVCGLGWAAFAQG